MPLHDPCSRGVPFIVYLIRELGGGPCKPPCRRAPQDRSIEIVRTRPIPPLVGAALQRHMAYAKDVQTLWYLRADLMGVLASHGGETLARAKLDRITLQFKGLLPKGLIARSSPLRI